MSGQKLSFFVAAALFAVGTALVLATYRGSSAPLLAGGMAVAALFLGASAVHATLVLSGATWRYALLPAFEALGSSGEAVLLLTIVLGGGYAVGHASRAPVWVAEALTVALGLTHAVFHRRIRREPNAVAAATATLLVYLLVGTPLALVLAGLSDPAWNSSLLAPYVLTGAWGGGVALVAILLPRGVATDALRADHVHAVARLLFTGVALWGYLAFCLALLVWLPALPRDIGPLAARVSGGGAVVTSGLVLGHFVLPFLVLVPRPAKRVATVVAAVGGLLCLGEVVDSIWFFSPRYDLRLYGGAVGGAAIAAALALCRQTPGGRAVQASSVLQRSALAYESP